METKARRHGPKISNGLLYVKRGHPRFEVDGLFCDIADGKFNFGSKTMLQILNGNKGLIKGK